MRDTLKEHELELDSHFESAVGLVSHPLTFPLTLGRFVNQEFVGASTREKLRVCVVGARAECTLPVQYWRELLVVTMHQNIDFQIDFVGPDVPLKSSKVRTVPLDEHSQVIEMRFKRSYLHKAIFDELKSQKDNGDNTPEKIKNKWDMFVLFNPGIGHPHLAKCWTPTLKFLAKTKKPTLITAHSEIDSERDLKIVQQMLSHDVAGEKLQYKKNPFSSRLESVDPFPLEAGQRHVTRANHSYISIFTSPN